MNRYDALMQRIQAGEKILIDGATGSELLARGAPRLENGWSGGGAMTHPEIVRGIHEDYIDLGANIIISNTFSTSRHICIDAGIPDQFEFLNRRGVELAIEARANKSAENVLVAGGISHWSFTKVHPPLDVLRTNMEDEAAIMAKAGAELIMLEMMVDIERMLIVLESAQKTGLPVWPGFSVKEDEDGNTILWKGPLLADALDAIADKDIPLITIMHSNVEFIDGALDVLQAKWDGPIAVYAHSGGENPVSAEAYAAMAEGWLKRGVNVIGSCCGFGVDYIKALVPVVEAMN